MILATIQWSKILKETQTLSSQIDRIHLKCTINCRTTQVNKSGRFESHVKHKLENLYSHDCIPSATTTRFQTNTHNLYTTKDYPTSHSLALFFFVTRKVRIIIVVLTLVRDSVNNRYGGRGKGQKNRPFHLLKMNCMGGRGGKATDRAHVRVQTAQTQVK